MDMQMPAMYRYDATKALRAEGYTKPIIAGCGDYLTRPVDRGMLVEVVAEYAQAENGNNVTSQQSIVGVRAVCIGHDRGPIRDVLRRNDASV